MIAFGRLRFAILVLAGVMLPWLAPEPGRADIVGTRHDFRRGPAARAPATVAVPSGSAPLAASAPAATAAGEDPELCVYCHTPYGERAQPGGPAWQRSLPPGASFPAYVTREDSVGVGMSFDVAGMSVVCLSCHDALQAQTVTSSVNEHPFGVPYRGAPNLAAVEARMAQAIAPGSAPAHLALAGREREFKRPSSATIDGRVVWWASSSGDASRRSRADLPLYTRRAGTPLDEVPFVECGSCHDPHSSNRLFLRASPDGGKLCLACHDK